MARICIVEDDPHIARMIEATLSIGGYESRICGDGLQAVEEILQGNYDMVLLDVMLPGMDGFEIIGHLRTKDIPVIFLTARGAERDQLTGYGLGADDYVVKPFEAKEVIARVKAVLRRSGAQEQKKPKEVSYDGLYINMENYELRVRGKQIDTPPKEMELIYHLASNPNRVYTRDQLLDEVWGFEYYGDSRTVDVHVKRLREKLDGVSDQWTLKTEWGVGYKFEVKDKTA